MDDVLGVGGNSTLGSGTVPSIMTYETSNLTGSRIRNITNTTLSVYFKLRIPQAYKTGFGRPSIDVFSSNLQDYKGRKDNSATIDGGEPNKGMLFEATFTMPPQATIRLVLKDVDFDKVMKQNLIDLFVTDEYYTQPLVVPPPIVRDVFEDGTLTNNQLPPPQPGYAWLNYTGSHGDIDPLGLKYRMLPEGFTAVEFQSYTGLVTAIRNDTGLRWLLFDTSAFADISPNDVLRVGNIDGGVYADGTASRVALIETCNPGDVYYVGPVYMSTGVFRRVYVNIVFVQTEKAQYT